jgi:hypothetical protein
MSAHGGRPPGGGGPKEAPPPKPDMVEYLPCVEGVGTSRNFWTVVRTGRYDWDNFLGAGLADQLLKTMRSEGNYGSLNYIIRDMIAGAPTPLSTVFFRAHPLNSIRDFLRAPPHRFSSRDPPRYPPAALDR